MGFYVSLFFEAEKAAGNANRQIVVGMTTLASCYGEQARSVRTHFK